MKTVKRGYITVCNQKRAELIALLKINNNIRQCATMTGINYENAKAIYRAYRLNNRVAKASHRGNENSRVTVRDLATKSSKMLPK